MTWQFVGLIAVVALWTVGHHLVNVLERRADTTKIRIGSPLGRSKSWEGLNVPQDVIEGWKEEKV